MASFIRKAAGVAAGAGAAALAGAALLCYALQAFFGISTPTCTGFFWIVWGLLEAAPEGKDGPSSEASEIDKEGSDMLL